MPDISFDRAVDYYDETRGFAPGTAEKIRDAILDYTHMPAMARFLELGIGTGRIALPFIEAGYEYDGTDISLAMMGKLEEKIAASTNRCHLIQNNITQTLPFKSGAYDVAIMVHVLHLVESWQAVLIEARRVLRPSGSYLLISQTERWNSHAEQSKHTAQASDPVHSGRLVRIHWREILRDLGVVQSQRGRLATQVDVTGFLEGMGATTQYLDLVEYDQPPISPRMMADRLKQRMYSADWQIPDDIHAEAVKRLDAWLATDCPEPDTATVGKGTFTVLVASWT